MELQEVHAYVAIVYLENSCKGDVCVWSWNAYEYTCVLICCPSPTTITEQIRMNTVQYHASHILRTHMYTEPKAVCLYMSGLYTVLLQWLLCMHYTLWCLVSPQVCVWAGTNGHLLPLPYTALFVVCQLVPNMVLCALGHVYWERSSACMHTAHGKWTQQPSHTHVGGGSDRITWRYCNGPHILSLKYSWYHVRGVGQLLEVFPLVM